MSKKDFFDFSTSNNYITFIIYQHPSFKIKENHLNN